MATAVVVISVWAGCAVAAWLLLCGYWWRRTMPLDAETATFFGLMAAIFGPLSLGAALVVCATAVVGDWLKAAGITGEKIIWPQRDAR